MLWSMELAAEWGQAGSHRNGRPAPISRKLIKRVIVVVGDFKRQLNTYLLVVVVVDVDAVV